MEDKLEKEYAAVREDIVAKTKELMSIAWTNERIKVAAQAWLDKRNDTGVSGRKAAAEYAEALQWGVATIDEVIAYHESAGADHAAQLADAQALKAKGVTSCPCPACTLCKELLALKDYL